MRLLECQSDAAYRKAIVNKMQEAITRGALLSRQLLDAERLRPKPLPRVHAAGLPSSIVGTEIAYTPSPNGGVFHVVNPATAARTS
jgi:hypothetical protein